MVSARTRERQRAQRTCLRGALPPVVLRAVCLVRAISYGSRWTDERCGFVEDDNDGMKERDENSFNKRNASILYRRAMSRHVIKRVNKRVLVT